MLAEARTYKREEDIHSCRAVSVGCPAGATKCVVFRRRARARCSAVTWVLTLTRYDGPEVLAKQITLVHVAAHVGGKRFYVAFDVSATLAATVARSDWENPYGHQMPRRSCAWQVHHFVVSASVLAAWGGALQ